MSNKAQSEREFYEHKIKSNLVISRKCNNTDTFVISVDSVRHVSR